MQELSGRHGISDGSNAAKVEFMCYITWYVLALLLAWELGGFVTSKLDRAGSLSRIQVIRRLPLASRYNISPSYLRISPVGLRPHIPLSAILANLTPWPSQS
jgi:hypothetical protein